MPEMPEVETIRRGLEESELIDKTVSGLEIFHSATIVPNDPTVFLPALLGSKLTAVGRRAKYLIFYFSEHSVLLHLRMTGKLSIIPDKSCQQLHERARILFDSGFALSFCDQRKFGRMYLLQDPETRLKNLGIEPLTDAFTLVNFTKIVAVSHRPIKSLLLDQNRIAGLGNIYVDEALWEAGIHPEQAGNKLSDTQIKILYLAIQQIIGHAIEKKGTSLGTHRSNYRTLDGSWGSHQLSLRVYGKEGSGCRRCGTLIVKVRFSQRGTHLCPLCQKSDKHIRTAKKK